MNQTTKIFFGWIAIVAFALIPVYLWFAYGTGLEEFVDYNSTTHSLGELFGLIGMTLFALTFVLSTRIKKIEDVFGGLDKVYIAHGILGGSALILILAHPIFLVLKFIPQNLYQAALYLLPTKYWSVNFGIISLFGLLILIYITLFTKVKYHKWKFTHEFLGLMFAFAVLHIFLVRGEASGDNIFTGYYIYAGVVSFIGISAFFYSLFLKNRLVKNAIYTISNIKKTKELFSIEMVPQHKPLAYDSGQFVFVRFYNESLSKELHPFSIASKSNSHTMRLIVKKLGDYTKRMDALNVGDKVSIEGPYGRFNYRKHGNKNQVWIAAGIGITPFLGMAKDVKEDKSLESVHLFYTVGKSSDFIGYDLLSGVANKNKRFKFTSWVSEDEGHLTIKKILEKNDELKEKEFLICGPAKFKEKIINDLIEAGVSKSKIHEEAFDFR